MLAAQAQWGGPAKLAKPVERFVKEEGSFSQMECDFLQIGRSKDKGRFLLEPM